MKRDLLNAFLIATLVFEIYCLFSLKTLNVQAASVNHIVISEVQTAGASPSADFIEIYNPTQSSINLNTFNLVKRTSSGATSSAIVSFTSSDVIPARGFFLWCFNDVSSTFSCNKHTSVTISNDNSIAIVDGSVTTGTVIDALTIGNADHPLGEGTAVLPLSTNTSIERKASSTSTPQSMGIGGVDEFAGNGEDTNNNINDFVIRSVPQPQNSLSTPETPPTPSPSPSNSPTPSETLTPTPSNTPTLTITPTEIPTPTLTPTISPAPTDSPSPTDTPMPTQSPTPTNSPTLTPSPTEMPSETPTQTPTPTISHSETPTPTQSPTPTIAISIMPTQTITPTITPMQTATPTPSLTATPSPSLTPTPSIPASKVILKINNVVCSINYKTIKIFFFQILIPFVSCANG